jgi:hypothetical protein
MDINLECWKVDGMVDSLDTMSASMMVEWLVDMMDLR